VPCPRLLAQRGGAFCLSAETSTCRLEKLGDCLLAFDDLADATLMESDLGRDLTVRETLCLSLRERCAASLTCCLDVGLVTNLGGTDRSAELILAIDSHERRLIIALSTPGRDQAVPVRNCSK
jgi:hypothetical protein